MFASLPHFLNGDAKLYENVIGLNPNRKIHDFTSNIF